VYIKEADQSRPEVYESLNKAVKNLNGIYITRLNQTSPLLPSAFIKIPVQSTEKLLSESYVSNVESFSSYLSHANISENSEDELSMVYIKKSEQKNPETYKSLEKAVIELEGVYISKLNQTSDLLPNALIKISVKSAEKLLSEP
jgi:archaellum component FlaF (FlaF/FlaG flagellin family)